MSDLSLQPDLTLLETPEFDTIVTEYESGVEQKRARRAGSKRKWRLVYKKRPSADMETIRDLFLAKKGKLTPFTWTNTNDSVEYTVAFGEDNFEFEYEGYEKYNFSIKLGQVL